MPEIKNQFTGGKMNKDLDERLVPKGEYRDAMNIQVSTSEGSDVGAVQNILGNIPGCVYDAASINVLSQQNPIIDGSSTVGSISDEKNDSLYWLVAGSNEDLDMSTFQATLLPSGVTVPNTVSFKDMIMRTNSNEIIAPSGCEPVFVDKYKWCTTVDPVSSSSLTDTILLDDIDLYSNITPGMQATGYIGSSVSWGPRTVTNVGTLSSLPVNYQSNTITQTLPSGTQTVPMQIRTFDSYSPSAVINSVYDEQFFNSVPDPIKGASNNTYPPSQTQIQFLINATLGMPSSLGVGSTLTVPVLFNMVLVVDSIITVPLYDDWNMGVGSLQDFYYLITANLPPTTVIAPSATFLSTVLTSNIANTQGRSQINNYNPFPVSVNSTGATINVPDDTICVPASSSQWLNEIYQILFEPGTTNPTGASLVIDNGVGAGSLWPPSSCIDPQSVIDPLGSVTSGSGIFDLGPPITYNTCFSVVECGTTNPVAPSSANVNNLPITLGVPNTQGTDAIYLDASVEMQDVDAICFESDRVLNFDSSRLITGINIIDDMLFWTDNFSEPKKINIPRSIEGTDPVGDTHTAIINNATGLSLSNYHPIKEDHISVIKKSPKSSLNLDLRYSRNPNENYSGVVTISDETNLNLSGLWYQRGAPGPAQSALNPYDFSTFTTEEGNNIVHVRILKTLDGNTNVVLNDWQIGSKVVLKEYDGSGQPPQIPINDYTIKGEVIAWDYTNASGVTVDSNVFSYDTDPTAFWGVKVAIKITSLSRVPQVVTSGGYLDYAIDLFDESEKLYEFKFPRFSYRYKYEDGEYSTFAPWTSVAFIPGAFDYHAKKGYNLGMTNNISYLWLRDYITPDMPLDVTQIDLLYKEESSPNVYIIETIRPDSEATTPILNQYFTSWAVNAFKIDKENIKAILPENQLLRPWDNVPKKALAQEVTGSRVVYGNYEQNYDLMVNGLKYNPLFQVNQVNDESSVKSIKSLREYQLGVVFTDKYGRETPVISNISGTFKVDKASAIKKNKLKIRLSNPDVPLEMQYFKFYIKETSGEYYNMAMDRYFDAEDGNLWISFASTDRNKIDIDTFLILKKGVDSNELVEDPARFKVIAIENEAPDFIKIKKNIISNKKHFEGLAGEDVFLPGSGILPKVNSKFFKVAWWDGVNVAHVHSNTSIKNIHKPTDPSEHYYFQIANENFTERSLPMRIAKIELDDSIDENNLANVNTLVSWSITLEEAFGNDILKFTDSPNDPDNVTKILDGSRCIFWSYKKENSAEFDGRFFVKIFEEDTFTRYIVNNPTASINSTAYSPFMSQRVYSFDRTRHAMTWQGLSGDVAGGGGSNNYTVSSTNNGNTPDIVDYFLSTNQTGQDYGDSGANWADHAAFFRGLNLHKAQESRQGTGSLVFSQHAFNMQRDSETMTLHSGNAYAGYDELEFEDVWFIDNETSQGSFPGGYSSSYNTTDYTGVGLDAPTGATIGQIELGFGGIQPQEGASAAGSNFPWQTPISPNVDPLIYNLSSNPNYSSSAGQFADRLLQEQVWGWAEDPNSQTYKFISVDGENNLLRHEASSDTGDIDEQYKQARGLIAAANYSIHNNIQYEQSTFFRPDNFSKNYRLSFVDSFDIATPIKWNPYAYGYIANGLIIPLIVQSISGVHNNEVVVTSLSGVDVSLGSYQNRPIHKGMVWDTKDVPTGSTWSASTDANDDGAVISEIISGNTLKLKQYNPNNPTGAPFPSVTAGQVILVKQYGMNGVSRNSVKNINKWNSGVAYSDTNPGVDAVGYTIDLKDVTGSSTEVDFPRFPAIFETEPKEQSELDIYYEISGNIPTVLNLGNISSILPVGSPVEIRAQDPAVGNLGNGVIPASGGIIILSNTFDGTGQDIVISVSLGGQPIVAGDKLIAYRPDGTAVEIEIISIGNSGSSPILTTFKLNPNLLQQNVTSNWYNCYSFGNGVESNRIRDNFNLPFIKSGVKVSTTLDYEYKKENRRHGLIYSGIYNSNSGVNNLNQFIQAEKITKDINPIYGSIQKLHSGWGQSGDLLALCEDRVLKILANKDALFNADGDTNVTATNKVLGTATPYSGEFGISENPESFASEAYRAYFTDKVRGVVMRLSIDGLTAISNHGMKDWFRDNLKLTNTITGSYDDKKDEYNVVLKDVEKTVSFREDVRGWVSFKSFVPEHANSCANEYYTFLDGDLWKHHVEQFSAGVEINRNTFYSQPMVSSSLNIILNEMPGSIKTFHTLNYEGSQSKIDEFREYDTFEPGTSIVRNHYNFKDVNPNFSNQEIGYYNLNYIPGWYVNSIVTDLEEGGLPEFIKKEGKWFNYIRGKAGSMIDGGAMINNISSGFNNANFSFQGIARVSQVVLSQILGCMDPTAFNYNPSATNPNPSAPCIAILNGCTDPLASAGYVAAANVDDGSCEYFGCMDPLASNYNSSYTSDPLNACVYPVLGCTDALALNYNSSATQDDGSCLYCVYGCTSVGALNYDSLATCDDGSCYFTIGGCMDPLATNYDSTATIDDGSCNYGGCTDIDACNYDPLQTVDDGSCTYCSNSAANVMNYDPLAPATCTAGCIYCNDPTVSLGTTGTNSQSFSWTPAVVSAYSAAAIGYVVYLYPSCALCMGMPSGPPIISQSLPSTQTTSAFYSLTANEYYSISVVSQCAAGPDVFSFSGHVGFQTSPAAISGCTDSAASNYNSSATVDDGSCIPFIYGCTDPLANNQDPLATADDGSCTYHVYGCMLGTTTPGAQVNSNYNPLATVNQVSSTNNSDPCLPCVYGCTDATQSNYDPTATCDDATCIPFGYGCTDPDAANFNTTTPLLDDGSCLFPGCTTTTALNYGWIKPGEVVGSNVNTWTVTGSGQAFTNTVAGIAYDDGSCLYPVLGCTTAGATNYNAAATQDDGSCTAACNSNIGFMTMGHSNLPGCCPGIGNIFTGTTSPPLVPYGASEIYTSGAYTTQGLHGNLFGAPYGFAYNYTTSTQPDRIWLTIPPSCSGTSLPGVGGGTSYGGSWNYEIIDPNGNQVATSPGWNNVQNMIAGGLPPPYSFSGMNVTPAYTPLSASTSSIAAPDGFSLSGAGINPANGDGIYTVNTVLSEGAPGGGFNPAIHQTSQNTINIIWGCMQSTSVNYNSSATFDDGSC